SWESSNMLPIPCDSGGRWWSQWTASQCLTPRSTIVQRRTLTGCFSPISSRVAQISDRPHALVFNWLLTPHHANCFPPPRSSTPTLYKAFHHLTPSHKSAMFKKPASFGLFLAVFLQVASGSFALSTAGSPQVGISHQQPIVSSSASTVIQQWSEVHTKFSQGQNVFNSGASVGVAIRSVQTLYHSCQTVSNQYSICDSCADAASSQVTALQCYASVWKSQFACESSYPQILGLIGETLTTNHSTYCFPSCLPTILYLGHGHKDRMLFPQSSVGCDLKGSQSELEPLPCININLSGLIGVLGGEIELFASPEASYADGNKNYDLSICLK
ncbi:hypothetical protein PSTT_02103, partial [Puccinia striiformis]